MMSRRSLFLALLALGLVLCLTGPVLSQSNGHTDEDEFGEYDEFETEGYAGTAMPYIPAAEPEKPSPKAASKPKQANYDDDEFEGVGTGSVEFEKEATFSNVGDFTTAEPLLPAAFKWNWLIEVGSIGFLVLFLITYITGRKANEKIASTFARTFRELFSSEFTTVGVNGAVLVKESQHTFRLNATGRTFVKGIQANLRLERRHDLVGRLYSRFVSPNRDLVDIQVAMNDDALDTIVFALTKNRDAREVSKDFSDLSLYTKSVKIPQDSPKNDSTLDSDIWTALAESKEVTTLLLDSATRATLNKYKDMVRLVHVTDQYSGHKEYKKVLHFVFYLPSIDRIEELRTLIKMVFHLIDTLARFQLPPAVKQSVEKARAKVFTEEKKEALEQRKEELEQQKLEKRREKMKNMDANERAEFEEKERQRKMNKRMKKIAVKA